jgi:ketol-acid reductoisomerase
VTEETRKEMKKMLEEIQSGAYAKKWIAENEAGRPWFNQQRKEGRDQLLEKVGAELRAMMPFLDAVTVTPEGEVVKAAEKVEASR